MHHNDTLLWGLLGAATVAVQAVHPWASIGASFGCCFFLASPGSAVGIKRLFLGLFSWGVGYAAGVFWFGEGPPWSQKAMLVSAAAGALAAVLFTVAYGMISSNSALPPWAESLLKVIPWRR